MGGLKRLTKPRFLFVYPLVVLLFLAARITEHSLRVGIAIIVLGEAIRLWANGYVGHRKVNFTQKWRGDAKVGRLTTAGPYAFVRHPLYLGSLLIGAGFCAAAGYLWLSLLALLGFAATYNAKMANEEALLLDECGEEYARYHAAVPRILPTWRRYDARHGSWSWRGVLASREWKTALWIAILLILLYFWEEGFVEREALLGQHRLLRLALLGVMVALMLTDGIAELVKRRRRISPSAAASP